VSAFSHFHQQPLPDDQFARLLELAFGAEPSHAAESI
jgi:hypothetical protein